MTLRQMSALNFLADGANSTMPYDLIFLDPPFASDLLQQCLEPLVDWPGWARTGLCYVEFPASQPPCIPEELNYWRQLRAGEVGFGLLRRI